MKNTLSINKENPLKGLFCLDHNIKVFIPSTTNTDQNNTESQNLQKEFTEKALNLFSSLFGGSTSYDATGAWNTEQNETVTESVKIVESYATKEQLKDGLQKVIDFAITLKEEMSQEAIALEYDNKLYLI